MPPLKENYVVQNKGGKPGSLTNSLFMQSHRSTELNFLHGMFPKTVFPELYVYNLILQVLNLADMYLTEYQKVRVLPMNLLIKFREAKCAKQRLVIVKSFSGWCGNRNSTCV